VVATCGCSANRQRWSLRRSIFAGSLASVCSSSNKSREASPAAQASGLPLKLWPWWSVRRCGIPRGRPVNGAVGDRRGERQVAAGEAFPEAENIGDDGFLLTGEHRAGAAEATAISSAIRSTLY